MQLTQLIQLIQLIQLQYSKMIQRPILQQLPPPRMLTLAPPLIKIFKHSMLQWTQLLWMTYSLMLTDSTITSKMPHKQKVEFSYKLLLMLTKPLLAKSFSTLEKLWHQQLPPGLKYSPTLMLTRDVTKIVLYNALILPTNNISTLTSSAFRPANATSWSKELLQKLYRDKSKTCKQMLEIFKTSAINLPKVFSKL